MKRLFTFAALIAVAVSMACTTPANAFTGGVTIKNETTKCAWITMYFASFYTPWDIAHHLPDKSDAPRWLKPGETSKWPMGAEREMKIRAEVKQNADCTGPTIADTYDIRKDGTDTYVQYQAVLMPNGGSYNLWFR
jgi:hypothetical protein